MQYFLRLLAIGFTAGVMLAGTAQEACGEETAPIEQEAEESVAETSTEPERELLGTWTITAYCNCALCCPSTGGGGNTASGVYPTAGHTAAHNYLDFGTIVEIEGVGTYVIEDRGDANMANGYWVDIYFDSHQDALNFGLKQANVWRVM